MENRCSICMNIQPLVQIDHKCTHVFCASCIDQWLEKHNTCPMCRCVVHRRVPQLSKIPRKKRGNHFANDQNLFSIAMLAGALL